MTPDDSGCYHTELLRHDTTRTALAFASMSTLVNIDTHLRLLKVRDEPRWLGLSVKPHHILTPSTEDNEWRMQQ